MNIDDFHIGDIVRDIKTRFILEIKPSVQMHTLKPLCKVVGHDYAWDTIKLLPLNPALGQFLDRERYGKKTEAGKWIYSRSPNNIEIVRKGDYYD